MPLNLGTFATKLHVKERQLQGILDELPVHIGGLLGCGQIGCTFQSDEGTVVKITADESEIALWEDIVELDERGIDLSDGVPEIYAVGVIPELNSYFVHREEVEPLVLGSELRLSASTLQWLFERDWEKFDGAKLLPNDWSFVAMLNRQKQPVPRKAFDRAALLDEDLHKLYVLTDVEEFAEREPSIMEDVWLESYIKAAMSTRGPLKGIGEAIATMVSESGTRWVVDVHLGNVGWRLNKRRRPQLLVYDWLTADLIPNGTGFG